MPAPFFAEELGVFLHVFNAVTATGEAESDTVIGLVRHLGAGTGAKGHGK